MVIEPVPGLIVLVAPVLFRGGAVHLLGHSDIKIGEQAEHDRYENERNKHEARSFHFDILGSVALLTFLSRIDPK